uniref:Uncharacterized protein n=1 Tax=Leviviridae sp. TaxID=2027243 RepID=A0A514D752_9VIRU|nr:MAG: hypothetical protein H2Rhizo31670_000005 [Leviviridae sp.]
MVNSRAPVGSLRYKLMMDVRTVLTVGIFAHGLAFRKSVGRIWSPEEMDDMPLSILADYTDHVRSVWTTYESWEALRI